MGSWRGERTLNLTVREEVAAVRDGSRRILHVQRSCKAQRHEEVNNSHRDSQALGLN